MRSFGFFCLGALIVALLLSGPLSWIIAIGGLYLLASSPLVWFLALLFIFLCCLAHTKGGPGWKPEEWAKNQEEGASRD